MERWAGKVALVTGASVGIGAAICRELVKHGLTVVGCARNERQIQELAAELKGLPGSLTAVHCDLEKSVQIEALFRTISERFGGVDICINNAGVNFAESLLEGSVNHWRTILNVNVLAVAHCSQLAIRSMKQRNVQHGQVITINSLAGHMVPPLKLVHFYTASKFAVTALTEGLRQELAVDAPSPIKVAQISPGMVKTEMLARAESAAKVDLGEWGERLRGMGMSASQIAEAVVYILSAPADVQVHDIVLRPTVQAM